MLSKALFLDRDGVINQETGYLHRVEDVRFVDGIFRLCRLAKSLGYKIVIVTNQSGIARGLYTEDDFAALMQWMGAAFEREGVALDGVYHCPYHPAHGTGEYRREHVDRKPGPGMMLRAAREHSLDLAQSVLIGDRCSDIAAANAAGLGGALLLAGTERQPCPGAYTLIATLAEAEPLLQRSFS